MKKILIICLMASAICTAFVSQAFSTNYILGAKSGYYAWEPFLKDAGFKDIDYGTGILYGPVISIVFTQDISLSLSGLFGKQSTHWQTDYRYDSELGYYIQSTNYFEAKRTDLDMALSYQIINNFKIFAGYKYLNLDIMLKSTELRTDAAGDINAIYVEKRGFTTQYHGPALGLGYSSQFGKGYFTAINLSGIYMWGKLKDWRGKFIGYSDPSQPPDTRSSLSNNSEAKVKQYGINFEPSAGFNSGTGLPIFTIGFRYQWLKIKFPSMDTNGKTKWYNDYLYGCFVSVMYLI